MQRPRAWTLQAVQVYFQSVIATKYFIYFIYCLTFVTSHHCLKWFIEQEVFGRSLCVGRIKHHHLEHSIITCWDWTWLASTCFFVLVATQHCTNFLVLAGDPD
ncbi:hypothetical protein V6Z11_A04G095800 [Gossypium hirsutum]